MVGTGSPFRPPSQEAGARSGSTLGGISSLPLRTRGSALPNGSGGFTFLELTIVLVLISLLTFYAAPRLAKTIRQLEVRTVTKKISSILRVCRNDAVNKNKIYQVSLDTESNQVAILSADEREDKLIVRNSYPLPKDVRMEKIEVGKTFFESPLPSFEFYPTGGANGGTAVVRSGEGRGYSIQVDFLTGMVKVETAKEK